MSVHDDWNGEGLVAHFIAHSSDPITSLTFDPSGTLLMTSDQQGRYFHLFKVQAIYELLLNYYLILT